jgi:transcriptional regulator with XRE-family HTH domain
MITFSGTALRRIRKDAGQKAEQLALAVDVSVYSIHQYERGTNYPTVPGVCRLADALGVPVGSLFEAEETVDAV